ncbi:hypothetical protein LVD17_07065 [Fulvivirga ulvae]|uniref:hypothetical protein n=1 Tax=Fulvivirga ulvae TaxID=2904245 RepID=UPI001F438141|nr:hypothetical protein [Fulvivirga ulvae]UII32784.1 hypothetical protein LVD17_02920 [Fulvivirga ulvae]UII33577.1 hypothetical protein LVD17_07065 [Fulvivirga ulvae]
MKNLLKNTKALYISVLILLKGNLLASTSANTVDYYIDMESPVIQLSAVGKDADNNYHFIFGFNWTSDTTAFHRDMMPSIDKLHFVKLDQNTPFYSQLNPVASPVYEFVVKHDDIDEIDEVKFYCTYIIGGRVYNTKPVHLQLRFENDPDLDIKISSEGLYYFTNSITPKVKLGANIDGVRIESLVIKEINSNEAPVLAAGDGLSHIYLGPHQYTEVSFHAYSGRSLSVNNEYFVIGQIRVGSEVKSFSKRLRALKRSMYYVVAPVHELEVYGNSDLEVFVNTSAPVKEVKAEILEASVPATLKYYDLEGAGENRWRLKINSSNKSISFGSYTIKFTGTSVEDTPLIVKEYSFKKKPITWKSIHIKESKAGYSITAELTYPVINKSDVELLLDSHGFSMSSVDNKIFTKEFSLNDQSLKEFTEAMNDDNFKRNIAVGIQVEGVPSDKNVIFTATILDMNQFEGKKKKEICEKLEEIGFEENLDKIALSISEELKKDEPDREWAKNVWSDAIEYAPKVLGLIAMFF